MRPVGVNCKGESEMKLTLQDVTQKKNEFEKACITLPSYDIEAVHKKTLEEPVWVHFGAGNIFRGYIAGLQEDLLNKGAADSSRDF